MFIIHLKEDFLKQKTKKEKQPGCLTMKTHEIANKNHHSNHLNVRLWGKRGGWAKGKYDEFVFFFLFLRVSCSREFFLSNISGKFIAFILLFIYWHLWREPAKVKTSNWGDFHFIFICNFFACKFSLCCLLAWHSIFIHVLATASKIFRNMKPDRRRHTELRRIYKSRQPVKEDGLLDRRMDAFGLNGSWKFNSIVEVFFLNQLSSSQCFCLWHKTIANMPTFYLLL